MTYRNPQPARAHAADWRDHAACLGYIALFDATHEANPPTVEASRICLRCPVRADCLDDAMATENSLRCGMRGGLTGDERRNLRHRQQPSRATKDSTGVAR